MPGQYNLRNPAVKRLMKEAQELREPTEQYFTQPLEDNLFEWHFTIRGPSESEFDGGLYHGRIILPPEYPMKPPSIIILTPNGRFEINKKICLSISGHHPESWQPSWSIRTALLAIIGFMPTHGAGAIGSLDYTPEERKYLAKKSKAWKCSDCGVVDDVLKPVTAESEKTKEEARDLASQINFQAEGKMKSDTETKKTESNAASPQPVTSTTPSTPGISSTTPSTSTTPSASPNETSAQASVGSSTPSSQMPSFGQFPFPPMPPTFPSANPLTFRFPYPPTVHPDWRPGNAQPLQFPYMPWMSPFGNPYMPGFVPPNMPFPGQPNMSQQNVNTGVNTSMTSSAMASSSTSNPASTSVSTSTPSSPSMSVPSSVSTSTPSSPSMSVPSSVPSCSTLSSASTSAPTSVSNSASSLTSSAMTTPVTSSSSVMQNTAGSAQTETPVSSVPTSTTTASSPSIQQTPETMRNHGNNVNNENPRPVPGQRQRRHYRFSLRLELSSTFIAMVVLGVAFLMLNIRIFLRVFSKVNAPF